MEKIFRTAQDPISCATHAAAAAASLGGGFVFLWWAVRQGSTTASLAAAMCFCLSLVALYSASALYHYYPGDALADGVKRRLRKLDHSMIYLLIAGSYTPFCVALLPAEKGLPFCGILWVIAICGVVLKMFWLNAPRLLSTLLYLAMGWSVLFVIRDFDRSCVPCLALCALGGVMYTAGAVLYALKRPNIRPGFGFHELFHLFIMAGSVCHYLAVLFFVL